MPIWAAPKTLFKIPHVLWPWVSYICRISLPFRALIGPAAFADICHPSDQISIDLWLSVFVCRWSKKNYQAYPTYSTMLMQNILGWVCVSRSVWSRDNTGFSEPVFAIAGRTCLSILCVSPPTIKKRQLTHRIAYFADASPEVCPFNHWTTYNSWCHPDMLQNIQGWNMAHSNSHFFIRMWATDIHT